MKVASFFEPVYSGNILRGTLGCAAGNLPERKLRGLVIGRPFQTWHAFAACASCFPFSIASASRERRAWQSLSASYSAAGNIAGCTADCRALSPSGREKACTVELRSQLDSQLHAVAQSVFWLLARLIFVQTAASLSSGLLLSCEPHFSFLCGWIFRWREPAGRTVSH